MNWGRAIAWLPLLLTAQGGESSAAQVVRVSDGAPVTAVDSVLSQQPAAFSLGAGESLSIARMTFTAGGETRGLAALSSELLTIAVTHGRLSQGGISAGPGQALVIALDGTRTQRLYFDAARLAASLSPGARPLLAQDIAAIARGQRRARFWGAWQPLRVNARMPGPPALEAARMRYLGEPAIVAQRRASASAADPTVRLHEVAEAFLSAWRSADAETIAALLDPAPFLSRGTAAELTPLRRAAAASLLADPGLRNVADAQTGGADLQTKSVALSSAGRSWRLRLVPRDRAWFVAALEPAQ